MHFKDPRWTKEPGPSRPVEPTGKMKSVLGNFHRIFHYLKRKNDSVQLITIVKGAKKRQGPGLHYRDMSLGNLQPASHFATTRCAWRGMPSL